MVLEIMNWSASSESIYNFFLFLPLIVKNGFENS